MVNNTALIVKTAFTVATVTALAWFSLPGVQAKNEQIRNGNRPPATLDAGGVKFSLKLKNPKLESGKNAVVLLTAKKHSTGARHIKPKIIMKCTPPGSLMARRVMLPKEVWSNSLDLVLQKGESKTIELKTDYSLEKFIMVHFQLSSGDQTANLISTAVSS